MAKAAKKLAQIGSLTVVKSKGTEDGEQIADFVAAIADRFPVVSGDTQALAQLAIAYIQFAAR